jgi:hypothetical protein
MTQTICKHDPTYICPKQGIKECEYPDLISCLKLYIEVLEKENMALQLRKMQKHTEASLKWRNQAFYYKRRCKLMEIEKAETEGGKDATQICDNGATPPPGQGDTSAGTKE